MQDFGKAIRILRVATGLSQAELGHALRLRQDRVSEIERGIHPKLHELKRLKKFFVKKLGDEAPNGK
jgi:transcriptional regulator with XRE-family HTH domain